MLTNNPHFTVINSAFPHIGEKITVYSGGAEFSRYKHTLFHDKRNDSRKGFPFEVLMALTSLADDHDREFPHLTVTNESWISTKKR